MTSPIKDKLQLALAVAKVGKHLSWAKSAQDRCDSRIAAHLRAIDRLKADTGRKTTWHEERAEKAALAIFKTQDDPSLVKWDHQHAYVDTGMLSRVEGRLGATEYPNGEAVAVAQMEALLTREELEKLIKVEKTIRKNVFKQFLQEHPDRAAEITEIVVPLVDTFAIEPHNSKQVFRRPVAWFLHRLE